MELIELKDNFYEMMGILKDSLRIENAIIRRKIGNKLKLVSSFGYGDNEAKTIRKIRDGVSGLSAEKNITVVVNNLDYYDKYFKDNKSIKSTISVPISINDEVIGTINFGSLYRNNFDDKKVKIIEKLADIYKHLLIINIINSVNIFDSLMVS